MTWISSQKFHFEYFHLKIKVIINIHKRGGVFVLLVSKNYGLTHSSIKKPFQG